MDIIKEDRKSFPLWFQDETKNANYTDEYFRCLKNLPIGSQTTSVGYISVSSDGNKWGGGVLAPNGYIYCAPWENTTILKINPVNDTQVGIGSFVGSLKYCGGVLASNGKIYFIPSSAAQVLVLDPSDDTTYTFGTGTFTSSGMAWLGGCLDKTGKYIYCAPWAGSKVLKINTETDTVTELGSYGGGNKWGGGAMGSNGHLYFSPVDVTTVMKIDTDTDNISLIGSLSSAGNKWYSAVTSKEGNIYFLTLSAEPHLKLTLPGETFSNVTSTVSSSWGGTLGVDGLIYCRQETINTTTDTSTSFSNPSAGTLIGLVTAGNGKVYGVPRLSSNIPVIGNSINNVNKNFTLSRFNNKL
jgi:hypothetical protein